jgi:hypothetical protein
MRFPRIRGIYMQQADRIQLHKQQTIIELKVTTHSMEQIPKYSIDGKKKVMKLQTG